MTLRTFERWLYRLGFALFILRIVGWFISTAMTEKVLSLLLIWAFMPLGILYSALKIREAKRTGVASVSFGFLGEQKADRTDPTLWIVTVGTYWAAAIMCSVFVLGSALGYFHF